MMIVEYVHTLAGQELNDILASSLLPEQRGTIIPHAYNFVQFRRSLYFENGFHSAHNVVNLWQARSLQRRCVWHWNVGACTKK